MAQTEEEAALRAKIQAMKNLLEAKKRDAGTRAPLGASHGRGGAPYRPVWAPNRSWQRAPTSTPYYHKSPRPVSANKVWKREDGNISSASNSGPGGPASSSSGTFRPAATARVPRPKLWKRSLKVNAQTSARAMLVKRAQSRMQLQVLKLEDGEYAKANGGFSLVRAGVKKVAPAISTATASAGAGRKTISAGGVQYVVAKGGKAIKRTSLLGKSASLSSLPMTNRAMTKTSVANAALQRAKASIQKARANRFAAKRGLVRTEYCRFYNRFGKCCICARYAAVPVTCDLLLACRGALSMCSTGFCNKKNECKFIHDSRRVAMCRKFLRNECADPNCLLSHQNDENKVPVCSLFLRGACTREGCKYRHVKVSATAAVCSDFVKGYCSKGAVCPLQHELPSKKRALSGVPKQQPPNSSSAGGMSQPQREPTPAGTSLHPSVKSVDGISSAGADAAPAPSTASSALTDGELSIRPNIRFVPRHGAAFSSLLEGL